MDHIVEHCPSDALNKLEEISYLIKHGDKIRMEEFLKVNQCCLHAKPGETTIKKATQGFITESKKHFGVSHTFIILNYFVF